LVRFRSVRKGARSWFRSGVYSIFPLFFDVGPWSHGDRYPCAAPNLVWKPTILPNMHSLTMAVLCTPCELKRLISLLHWLWESIAWSSRHLTNPRQIMYGQGSCYRQSEFICQAPVPKLVLFYQGAWATRAVVANGDTWNAREVSTRNVRFRSLLRLYAFVFPDEACRTYKRTLPGDFDVP
jgi:hypothetical protein